MGPMATIISQIPIVPIAVGAFLIFYWIRAFIIMYHLVRFGIGPAPKFLALLFLVGSGFFFMVAISLYVQLDTSQLFRNIGDSFNQIKPQLPSY